MIAAAALVAVGLLGTDRIAIRGEEQELHLYGRRGGPAALVASGDGGWVHLGPEVAEFLAGEGYFVVGFDVKRYLESFTKGKETLSASDVPGDFQALVDYTARGAAPPVLVGISEGASLAVLAATGDAVKPRIRGVLALGLPDRAELGWRLRDSLIYLTKGSPNEPSFLTSEFAARMSPVPLAAIHSAKDEYVPVAEARGVVDRALPPKQFWVVEASDHRFSDNQPELQRCIREALAWIGRAR